MFKKKNFTLIELIVVIAVLGILASIVIPNISNMQERSKIVALQSDVRNVQTAVDMYFIEKNDTFPSYSVPTEGNPAVLDFSKLKVDFLREDSQFKDLNWWVDVYGIVYCSAADYPQNIVLSDGSITWDKQDNVKKYRIYKIPNSSTGAATGKSIQLIGETENNEFNSEILSADTDYLIEAVDVFELTTPKFGKNYNPVSSGEESSEHKVWPLGTSINFINGGTYSGTGNDMLDGDLSTYWNGNGFSATFDIVFPEPTLVTSLKIHSGASPESKGTYTYSGSINGEWVELGSKQYILTGAAGGGFLESYSIPSGKYEKIRISINVERSWAAVTDIFINQ